MNTMYLRLNMNRFILELLNEAYNLEVKLVIDTRINRPQILNNPDLISACTDRDIVYKTLTQIVSPKLIQVPSHHHHDNYIVENRPFKAIQIADSVRRYLLKLKSHPKTALICDCSYSKSFYCLGRFINTQIGD